MREKRGNSRCSIWSNRSLTKTTNKTNYNKNLTNKYLLYSKQNTSAHPTKKVTIRRHIILNLVNNQGHPSHPKQPQPLQLQGILCVCVYCHWDEKLLFIMVCIIFMYCIVCFLSPSLHRAARAWKRSSIYE